jgi:hypothetical protein
MGTRGCEGEDPKPPRGLNRMTTRMNDATERTEELTEEAPAEPERLMEIVIRVCEQYGFPRKGIASPPDEPSPKR